MNPLLDFSDLPRFDAVEPAHISSALDVLLTQAKQGLAQATDAQLALSWHALALALDVQTERLSMAWGTVNHLNSVADTPELRAAYNEALPRVTEFWTQLGSNEALFAQYKRLDAKQLNPAQQQALKNALRGFVLGGADLQGAAKERFAAIQEQQAQLSQKFSENNLDSTDAFAYYATDDELDGVPDDVIDAGKALAKSEDKNGCKLTLKMPCYLPIMQFAKSSALREKLYKAYTTRASDQAPVEQQGFDNSPIIHEILQLRHEEAQLLGYDNFAQVSLASKMAPSPEHVVQFLRDLAQRARPYAEQDLADMRQFALENLQMAQPQAWDWTFISERLKEQRYAFSETDVKNYFTAPKVLKGLFDIAQTLFDIQIKPDQAATWNTSVQFFRIKRQGQIVGQFYLDLHARPGKRSGAWMDDVRSRWLRPDTGRLQTPVAHLVCNFASGTNGKPALLTHDDVITLFHEFGHGIHHLLTQIDERDVSGISGVEWDAVELPSQFMENFCWEWPVVQGMTAHVDTGEPLPRALFDKMLAAKNFQSGMQTLRQVEFSLFDMLLHMQAQTPVTAALDMLQQVRQEVSVLPPPAYNRAPHTFGHIFSGGYAAGYYSYKWAEVLSSDAYAAFEEGADPTTKSTLNASIGLKYRQAILEVGGSRPAMESFKAFRGREPSLDALLRHQGMKEIET